MGDAYIIVTGAKGKGVTPYLCRVTAQQ